MKVPQTSEKSSAQWQNRCAETKKPRDPLRFQLGEVTLCECILHQAGAFENLRTWQSSCHLECVDLDSETFNAGAVCSLLGIVYEAEQPAEIEIEL
jgi:hypothetical protein